MIKLKWMCPCSTTQKALRWSMHDCKGVPSYISHARTHTFITCEGIHACLRLIDGKNPVWQSGSLGLEMYLAGGRWANWSDYHTISGRSVGKRRCSFIFGLETYDAHTDTLTKAIWFLQSTVSLWVILLFKLLTLIISQTVLPFLRAHTQALEHLYPSLKNVNRTA